LPSPPPEAGGFYIWWEDGVWSIANHIYSPGNSLEQFHGSILAVLDQPPQLNVNVFIREFELWGDTTSNYCLDQNDRWGWVQWDTDLYEIWWDVTTKEKKASSEDLNDFVEVRIAGCALDFNLWSSAHGGPFGADQVYLGVNKTPLNTIPEYEDAFVGVEDPYQSQAGTDPQGDPNITIFTPKAMPGASYNKFGEILPADSFPCAPEYGSRYAGAFAYEGNGIQFSTLCHVEEDQPPNLDFPSGTSDTSFFACVGDSICVQVLASDPDANDTVTLTLLQGPVDYPPRTEPTMIVDTVCFYPDSTGTYRFIWQVEDQHGAMSVDTVDLLVTMNTPPVLLLPSDVTKDVCSVDSICVSGIYAYDVDSLITGSPTTTMIEGPGYFDAATGTVCFLPDDTGGVYRFIFEVCDICLEPAGGGLAASVPALACPTDTLYVTVNVNRPPFISPPAAPGPFACVPATGEVCTDGWVIGDPDGDALSIAVPGAGTFDSVTGVFCTPVDTPGTYTQTLVVTDSCGLTAETTLTFTVLANEPPVVDIGVTDSTLLCTADSVCIDFTVSDPDDTLLTLWSNIGVIHDGQVCFEADTAGTYTVIVEATDECGVAGADTALVDIGMNQPPYIEAPDTTLSVLCEGADLACLSEPVWFGDPDAGDSLTLHLPAGVTYDGETGTLCVPVTESGWYEVVIGATDLCGATVWDTIQSEIVLNTPPVITFSMPDTTIFTCSPDTQICFNVSAEDAAGHPVTIEEILNPGFFDSETGQVCFNPDSICFDHPETVDTTICLIFKATGDCGSTIDSLCITVVSNRPPLVTLPPDTTVRLCVLEPICVGPVGISDPDGETPTVTGFGATYDAGQLCFTPDSEGTYTIGVEVSDSCGHVVRDSLQVTVLLNAPPTVELPDDYALTLCGPGEVCIPPAIASDPDGDSLVITMSGADADGCFTASTAGTYEVVATATDSCGASASDTINVTVQFNTPPRVVIRSPQPLLLCDIDTTLCYAIHVSDFNPGDSVTLSLVKTDETMWSLVDGRLCLDASVALAARDSIKAVATVEATDECGAKGQATISVILKANRPPTASLPADTTILLCEPQSVCLFPVEYGDPNGEPLSVEVTGGDLVGDSICNYFDHDTTLLVTLTVTDSCGATATDSMHVTVHFDQAPTLMLPDVPRQELCALAPVCVDGIFGNDPELGTIPAALIGGNGTFDPATGELCFTPEADGIYSFVFEANDGCSADTGTLAIEVTTNLPPVFGDSPDSSLSACLPGDELCLQFAATDAEGDAITYVLESGPGTIDPATGKLCFTPDTSGRYEFIVSASDSCGVAVYDTGWADIHFNQAPELHFSSSDTSLYVCNPDTLLCFTVTATDPDGETPVIREILNPGTFNPETGEFCFNPDSVCFDDPMTVDTTFCLIFAASDACGVEVVDTLCIEVTRNRGPVVALGPDTTLELCEPQSFCVDFAGHVYDPDGDLLDIVVTPPAYNLEGASACVDIDTSGVYRIIVCATDPCGLEACDTLLVTATINRPPTVSLPDDTTIVACTVGEVCLGPVSYSDPDAGDSLTVTVSGGAALADDQLCFTPDAGDGDYTFVVTVTDRCGAEAADTITVTVDANDTPVLNFPAMDTTVWVCNPDTELCFVVTASDPDGDTPVIDEILNPGFFDPLTGTFCVYPDSVCFDSGHVADTTIYVIFRATDACGAQTVDSMGITIIVNKPPEVRFSVPDTSYFLCNPDTTLCFDVWGGAVLLQSRLDLLRRIELRGTYLSDLQGDRCVRKLCDRFALSRLKGQPSADGVGSRHRKCGDLCAGRRGVCRFRVRNGPGRRRAHGDGSRCDLRRGVAAYLLHRRYRRDLCLHRLGHRLL